jgi:branched-chain amino acid transport system substrate-binding protein
MIRMTRRAFALSTGSALTMAAVPSLAYGQSSKKTVKVGVLTDMSGFASDANGKGSVLAAQMAAEDFAKELPDMNIEVIFADHQNKPDIGGGIARKWIDTEKVNAILDIPVSSVALAVNEITRNSNALFIASGPGSTDLTGSKCSPHLVHWTYDTWALARGTAKSVTESGKKKWFFLTADYAFGHALEKDATELVRASGGTVVGAVRHPINTPDFSSFLLQAQASGADVIALANAVGDTINSIKQAAEFNILGSKQSVVALLLQLTDVHSLGLQVAKGLFLTQPFYWDQNAGTREFADRFAKRLDGRRPTDVQAGVYAGFLHYLKAVKQTNDTSADTVIAAMKAMPTDDPLFGRGRIRSDGRKIHPTYVMQVKTPAESKGPWDYFKIIDTIPAEEAFRPENQGGCPLVKT